MPRYVERSLEETNIPNLVSSILADGKNSRLYKRLVYDTQMAQDVSAYQQGGALGSSFG